MSASNNNWVSKSTDRWKIGTWFSLSLLGISTPYLLEANWIPSRFELFFNQNNDEGFTWFWLGWTLFAMTSAWFLKDRANRLATHSAHLLANIVTGIVFVVFAVLAAVAICMVFAIIFGELVPWLSDNLPEIAKTYLQGLDREPGAFWVGGTFGGILGLVTLLIYTRLRSRTIQDEFGESRTETLVLASTMFAFPIVLNTFAVAISFVTFGLIVALLELQLPNSLHAFSQWVGTNRHVLIGTSVALSLSAAPLICVAERLRRKEIDPDPEYYGVFLMADYNRILMKVLGFIAVLSLALFVSIVIIALVLTSFTG